ncbi:GNAT family N-acetyltransferase [Streptomyces sp. G45]|uniref:GNAT family N-acetyltransferase n=1 Tax=Streptomyces sp. G45 TaxID=3406627 RepID=UPI003C133EDD
MGTPLIQRATAEDAAPLTALMHASRAYQGAYAPMIEGYRVTAAYIARHEVYKAVDPDDGDRLLGFYALVLDPLVLDPPELDLAFVADAAQGRGVGRLLMDHMKERARSAGLRAVRVVSNPPAEGFYRSVGAVRTGTVPPKPPRITWERPELSFDLA